MKKYVIILLLFAFLLPLNTTKAAYSGDIIRSPWENYPPQEFNLEATVAWFTNIYNWWRTLSSQDEDEQEVPAPEGVCTWVLPTVAVQTSNTSDVDIVLYMIRSGYQATVINLSFVPAERPEKIIHNDAKGYRVVWKPNRSLTQGEEYKYKVCARPVGANDHYKKYCKETVSFRAPACTLDPIATLDFTAKYTESGNQNATSVESCYRWVSPDGEVGTFTGTETEYQELVSSGNDISQYINESIIVSPGDCGGAPNAEASPPEETGDEEEGDGETGVSQRPEDGSETGETTMPPGAQSGLSVGVAGPEDGQSLEPDLSFPDFAHKSLQYSALSGLPANVELEDQIQNLAEMPLTDLFEDTPLAEGGVRPLQDLFGDSGALEDRVTTGLRDQIAKLIGNELIPLKDLKEAVRDLEKGVQEAGSALDRFVRELGYTKEALVLANAYLNQLARLLADTYSLGQLVTAERQSGNRIAGEAANLVLEEARERGLVFMEIEEYLAKAQRWLSIALATNLTDKTKRFFQPSIKIVLDSLDKADEKCEELKDQCPTETKNEISLVREIIESLPQTKTTSTSQQEEDNE